MTQPKITSDLTKIKKIECEDCKGKKTIEYWEDKNNPDWESTKTAYKDKFCSVCKGQGQIPQWIDYKAGECDCSFCRNFPEDKRDKTHFIENKEIVVCKNCGHGIFLCNGYWFHHQQAYSDPCFEIIAVGKIGELPVRCGCTKPEPIKLLPIKTDKNKERILIIIK